MTPWTQHQPIPVARLSSSGRGKYVGYLSPVFPCLADETHPAGFTTWMEIPIGFPRSVCTFQRIDSLLESPFCKQDPDVPNVGPEHDRLGIKLLDDLGILDRSELIPIFRLIQARESIESSRVVLSFQAVMDLVDRTAHILVQEQDTLTDSKL